MKYVHTKSEAKQFSKYGIDIVVYGEDVETASVCHVTVKEGHFEEFKSNSHFMYYIIEGEGVFVLDDNEVPVKATDLVVIPPNTRIHYFGTMKMTLTVTPAWKQENEEHVRDVKPEENPLKGNV